jgi:hypothetical protein
MNDSRDGKLVVPSGATVHTVSNPGWEGSDVAKSVRHTITHWSKHASDPLFRKDTIDIGDINQEGVGDCWYLAALVSILNVPYGSDLLKKTMLDVGEGFVIVRLFDGNLTPWYLRVQKSILWYSGFGKLHVTGIGKTGLWAAMLEKAACCMQKDGGRTVCDPNSPNYKNIEGGHGDEAFRMLLGVRSLKTTMQNVNHRGERHGSKTAEQHILQLFSTGNWRVSPQSKDNRDALNAVFGWNGMSVLDWQRIVLDLQRNKSALLQGDFRVGSTGYGTEFTRLLNMPSVTHLSRSASLALAAYAKSHNAFSGHSGTGTYSGGANTMFDDIKNKILSGCPVGMGTQKDVGPIEGRGKSAGESMSRGMVGGHAYAILGTFEETVMMRRKWIKLSNPWNRYGRAYSESGLNLTPKEQECGAFWAELKDFGDVVDNLYFADAPGRGK